MFEFDWLYRFETRENDKTGETQIQLVAFADRLLFHQECFVLLLIIIESTMISGMENFPSEQTNLVYVGHCRKRNWKDQQRRQGCRRNEKKR